MKRSGRAMRRFSGEQRRRSGQSSRYNRDLMRHDVTERDLGPAPDVPVVVILAAKPYAPRPGLPFDSERHFRADLSHRIEVLQDWALASERGTLVVTNHASHAVPRDDPDLIVWAVQRVLTAVAGK
jgi:pimeloyl-ACP methyl ester carboxylesterase